MAFADALVTNCTFVGNTSSFGGPAACTELSVPPIRNCIAWGNAPPDLGGVFDARYCCLESALPGDGNLSADPEFVTVPAPGGDGRFGTADDELGDLGLRWNSPCIDAGDNGALQRGTTTDLAGTARFADDPGVPDVGVPAPPVVDLGAYERHIARP